MTDKPDAGELLLCPFCGGEAEMDTQRAYRNIETSHVEDAVAIYCLSCSADMTMCKRDVRPMSDEDIIEALRDQWNRRSSSKRIEELEAGLSDPPSAEGPPGTNA